MSTTAHMAIASAVVSALAAAPALAGGRVSLNKLRPVAAGDGTAIVVRQGRSIGQEQSLGVIDWTTDLTVECHARAAAGAEPAAAVDTLLFDAWARLAALDAASLGAMAVQIGSDIDWQFDDLDPPVAAAVIRLQVVHRTAATSLTART